MSATKPRRIQPPRAPGATKRTPIGYGAGDPVLAAVCRRLQKTIEGRR